jgi:hypothetical protein
MANGLFQEFNPIQRLATNQYGLAASSRVGRGSLISFYYPKSWATYPNVIHDPYPMVILTDIWPDYIRGLNLHYLTFPYIKKILQTYGGQNFTYTSIRPDAYMAQAFRMYVRRGVQRPKLLDMPWLQSVLQEARSFSPGEVEKIRMSIQKQIQQRLQAKANELTSYEDWRRQLTQSQQRQLRRKGLEGQNILTGGMQRNLVKPEEPMAPEPQQQQPIGGQPPMPEENL